MKSDFPEYSQLRVRLKGICRIIVLLVSTLTVVPVWWFHETELKYYFLEFELEIK